MSTIDNRHDRTLCGNLFVHLPIVKPILRHINMLADPFSAFRTGISIALACIVCK